MEKKVGIIIIGYKDYVNRYLLECRDSLRAQTYPKEKTRVYIIDNCSINNGEYIKKNYPKAVRAARSGGNYAAANNLGVKMALDDGCELLVIANMDVRFDRNWLSELVKAVESGSGAGAAQSKMLLYPKTKAEWSNPKINSLGNIIHFLGFGFTNGYNEPDREIKGLPEITGYASGCSFIMKKEVLDIIGGYNEDYYMYHDDVEIGWKIKLAGFKTVLAPKSIMYHKYEFHRSIKMLYYMERNRHLVMFHFYKWPTLLLLLPAIMAMDIGMVLYSLLNGWFGTMLKVIGYFLLPASWIKIIKARQSIRSIRKIEDRAAVKDLSGRILFQEINNPVLKYIANPILDLYWRIVKKLIVW